MTKEEEDKIKEWLNLEEGHSIAAGCWHLRNMTEALAQKLAKEKDNTGFPC